MKRRRNYGWLHVIVVVSVTTATIMSMYNMSTMIISMTRSSISLRHFPDVPLQSSHLPPLPTVLSSLPAVDESSRYEMCIRQQQLKSSSSSSSSAGQFSSFSFSQQQNREFLPALILPPSTKNETMTLRDAFQSNYTTVYFLHQRKAAGSAIREILYYKLRDVLGNEEEARRRSFVPCITHPSRSYEMPLLESNSLHNVKLVAAHMSYHVPFARALFDYHNDDDHTVGSRSVFITNFREPLSRIKSCMFYRYPEKVHQLLLARNFTIQSIEHLFMTERDEYEGRTCVQEPFRILSPFHPDQQPVPQHHIDRICCYVKSYFHVINQFQKPPKKRRSNKKKVLGTANSDNNNSTVPDTEDQVSVKDLAAVLPPKRTVIEQELLDALKNTTINKTPYIYGQMNKLEDARWIQFAAHVRRTNPFVRSEINLYNCIFDI